MTQHKYYVSGMHCPACELLITRKVAELDEIKNIKCSASSGVLEFESENSQINANYLDEFLKKYNYRVSDTPNCHQKLELLTSLISVGLIILAIAVFLGLHFSGALSQVRLDNNVTWWSIVLFGLVAGFSTCAALNGGVLLALTKHWAESNVGGGKNSSRLIPQLMFNIGRIIGFAFFGAILGLVGSAFRLSPITSAWLVMFVAVIMIVLALQMLGVSIASKFNLALPKSISNRIAESVNLKWRWIPLIIGALTFFLPCGFSLTAQSYALMQGNAIASSLTMVFFALGTLPALLIIGITSSTLISNPKVSHIVLKLAGAIVLIFALYNINNQFNILGLPSMNSVSNNQNRVEALSEFVPPNDSQSTQIQADSSYAPPKCVCCASSPTDQKPDNNTPTSAVIKGKVQVIKMNASASEYTPNYFKIKQNIPVRWEITDDGTSGCTNAVIAPKFFNGDIKLVKGTTSVKEFMPKQVGKFRFSCWMGIVTGTIEVVK